MASEAPIRRGARTVLEALVPAHFRLSRQMDVTNAIERGRLHESRLRELSPVVFAAAVGGDTVARSILDRLADELATMGLAIIRRLHLTRRDVDVVLAGGVFRAQDPTFEARIASGIHLKAPLARLPPARRAAGAWCGLAGPGPATRLVGHGAAFSHGARPGNPGDRGGRAGR